MEIEARKRFLINIAFVSVGLGLIFFTARFLISYLMPFVIGSVLAFAVQKPAGLISKKIHISKGASAALLTAFIYIILVFLLFFMFWRCGNLIYGLSDRITDMLSPLASFTDRIYKRMSDMITRLPEVLRAPLKGLTENSAESLFSGISGFITKTAAKTMRSFPTFMLSGIVTLAASIYIAKDFDRLIRFIKGILKPETVQKLITVRFILVNSVLKLLLGYFILMLITFAELFIGFMIIKVKHAFLLAFISAVLDLLPVIGTGAVLLPMSVISFIGGNTAHGIGLIALYIVITVIRNIAEPKIIGKQIGITPLLTLLTMFLGLKVAGVAGMILLPLSLIVTIEFYRGQIENDTVTDKRV